MDVRCEKCQTEYELDESRLKPGGVTVKCTNCGHMFKIRKRTPTNVGLPAVSSEAPTVPRTNQLAPDTSREETRREPAPQRTPPAGMQSQSRADSVLGEVPSSISDGGSGPTTVERQWLVRLENGEQKTCRELATLQQWIVAGVATRESLISRSGKTWKRLGDITELAQYFRIADEARQQRNAKPTPKPQAATMMGVGQRPVSPTGATAAGGTILPDDDELKTTGSYRNRRTTPPPPPPPSRTPPTGSPSLPRTPDASPVALQQTEISAPGRATGAWASTEIKKSESMGAMPSGPRGGKLAMPDNEPAFAGRVRLSPGDESSFQTGKVSRIDGTFGDDDDDAMVQPQRGSRAGTWIALLALVVIAAGAGAVYMLVFNKKQPVASTKQDGGAVAAIPADAPSGAVVQPIIDAAPADPLDSARNELLAGIEPRIKGVYDSLAPKDDPASLAMRARLACGMAQSMIERAGLTTDKTESDKLRKDAKQIVIDAAPLAQHAVKAAADDPSANIAMADVLRLQGKPIKDVQHYLDAARSKGAADKELARSIGLSDALTLQRDAKLEDAQKELIALDGQGDARIQQELALIAFAQGKPADAKPFVDQILGVSPDHDVARALSKRLETAVVKTDPMPSEGSGSVKHDPAPTGGGGGGGGDYDSLLARADKLASTSCTTAMPLYSKALEQKPTGVEALTGMGYCYLDGKQFSSAFSKFSSALAVSSKFEPALAGVAETYQQQGNKDQAIEAWKRYLEAIPGSAKAKKQLELLGAGAPAPTPPPAGSDTAPAPTPAPTPTPAPATDGSAAQ